MEHYTKIKAIEIYSGHTHIRALRYEDGQIYVELYQSKDERMTLSPQNLTALQDLLAVAKE